MYTNMFVQIDLILAGALLQHDYNNNFSTFILLWIEFETTLFFLTQNLCQLD